MKTLPAIQHRPARLGVLISGGGTTLLNFLDCQRHGLLDVEIPMVIASQPNCRGVARAAEAGLKCVSVVRGDYPSIAAFSEEVFGQFRDSEVDVVAMAGYLSLLRIPDDFTHRVLNIHPSLIPSFCGKGMYGHRVHEAVVDRGVKVSGCTVHFADNEYDHGPVIVQRTVDLPDNADADEIATLVFAQEKIAYPEAIRRVVSGRLSIVDNRTIYVDR